MQLGGDEKAGVRSGRAEKKEKEGETKKRQMPSAAVGRSGRDVLATEEVWEI